MLGKKLKTIAALATATAMLVSMTACGNGNTASSDTIDNQNKSEVKMDDSTPTALVKSFMNTIKAGDWDSIPGFFTSKSRPKMAGETVRKSLVEPIKNFTVDESYEDDGDVVVPVHIGDNSFDTKLVKSPEGGWRFDEYDDDTSAHGGTDGLITDIHDHDGVCVEALGKKRGAVLPGKYVLKCSTSYGIEASQTVYQGIDGENSIKYTKWPSKDKLVQQVTDAIKKRFNSGRTEIQTPDGYDIDAIKLTSDIDVQDVGNAGNDVWAKAVFNFTYTLGESGPQHEWVDNGTGMWWSIDVAPDRMTMTYRITALNPTDTPDGYESALSD